MTNIKGLPLPLGVTERHGMVNFAIETEVGQTCRLCIYKKGELLPESVIEMPEHKASGNVRFLAIPSSKVKGREYHYEIDGKKVLDAYVKRYRLLPTSKEPRGQILSKAYDWEEDQPLHLPIHKVIAYTLHIRGFTKHRSSSVRKKGTFYGLIEKIPYLKELGINQLQCMPVYDFDETTPYKNYWGYGNGYYFALKQTYASTKNVCREFKDMVKMLHQNGIEVVLSMPFTRGVANTLILDCLRYYVLEYHIDGFIINPDIANLNMLISDPLLKQTKILQSKDQFQNVSRRFLRGDTGIQSLFMQACRQVTTDCGSCNYITNHTGFTLTDLVSYNTKHNEANGENNCDGPEENYSWNCGREGHTSKQEILELRNRQRRNALAILFFAQGTPCILAGDEFGNSQNGNNNVYCQDNITAWLDWNHLHKDHDFFTYTKRLIEIRKAYPALAAKTAYTGTDKIGCGVPDISYHGDNAWQIDQEQNNLYFGIYYHHEDGSDLFVAYNMDDQEHSIALPQLSQNTSWHCLLRTDKDLFAEEDLRQTKQYIVVEARCIMLFEGR